VEVKLADLPAQVQATGTVTPRVGAEVKVGPRVSGRLERLLVKVGDSVKKGAVLAVVESLDLQAGVQRADANLREAEAALAYAQSNFARQQALVKDGIISADQLDVNRKALDSAHAQVKNAKAALDQARINLSYATVSAPISGTVASVSTQEGETVAASLSAPTFVTLVDLNRLEVDAFVDEVDIGRVKVGQAATFTVDAYPDKVFEGKVEAIYPQAVIQDNVVNYPVIIRIDGARGAALEAEKNGPSEKRGEGDGRPEGGEGRRGPGLAPRGEGRPEHPGARPPEAASAPGVPAPAPVLEPYEGLLRPQMTASVSILLDTLRGALVIPIRAVKRESGQAFVLVKEGEKTARRPVSLGRESGDMVQVKSGLSAGDRVLVSTQRSGESMP
jgi:RND family efflux transporter MFP subunit